MLPGHVAALDVLRTLDETDAGGQRASSGWSSSLVGNIPACLSQASIWLRIKTRSS